VKVYFDGLRTKVLLRLGRINQFLDAQLNAASGTAGQTIVATRDGVPVIETQSPPKAVNIEAEWAVESVRRDQLDLEALRYCFTDHQLMLACKRHLRETGQRHLAGVQYEQHARLGAR